MTQEHDAIAVLNRYRLEADLSYERLAAEMRGAGQAINTRTLQNALTGSTVARDRTRHKLELFARALEAAAAGERRSGRDRRRQAVKA